MKVTYQEILKFWFEEITPDQQFGKDESFDQKIRERFLASHQEAMRGELYLWRNSAQGRLAEIILLDQFSRNMFRDQPQAFASDAVALTLAQEAVLLGIDKQLAPQQRIFLYMPYMHSESAEIHKVAIVLFNQPGLEENLRYELLHKTIIDRFGRFPHRNRILGRASTPEELEFLKQPNSSF